MMTEDQTLDQLCGLFGIAVDYTDGRDERRQVPAKSKRALLVAMGLDLDDASDLQQVLQHCETRSWQRLLPPVLVVRQSAQAARILINLPAELTETQLNWTLVLENGERHYGYLRPHELETLAVYRDGQISRYGFSLPLAPNIGYHCFKLARPGQRPATMRLIVAPRRCYQAPLLTQGERLWGPAVQVYGL
jgi:(1->4)-alpha-D-glucan 1-alpha-D-glucosylmutase